MLAQIYLPRMLTRSIIKEFFLLSAIKERKFSLHFVTNSWDHFSSRFPWVQCYTNINIIKFIHLNVVRHQSTGNLIYLADMHTCRYFLWTAYCCAIYWELVLHQKAIVAYNIQMFYCAFISMANKGHVCAMAISMAYTNEDVY